MEKPTGVFGHVGTGDPAEVLRRARVIADEDLSADLVRALAGIVGRPVERGTAGLGADSGERLVYVGPSLPAGLAEDRLLWFHSTNAGVDALLRDGRWPHRALLTRTVGRMGERIGQFVLAWVLAECQDIPAFVDQHRQRVWERRPTRLVGGDLAVVFGAGAIGAAVGRSLGSCGLRTVGVASREREVPGFDSVTTPSRIGDVLPKARWVVSTLPLTPATEGLFDARLFGSMAGATFINVGRGATVDQDALAAALAGGAVGRAVLDVLAEEPPGPDDPCWSLPRTVVTSHSSGVTADEDVASDFAECWRSCERGLRPRLAVATARGY